MSALFLRGKVGCPHKGCSLGDVKNVESLELKQLSLEWVNPLVVIGGLLIIN